MNISIPEASKELHKLFNDKSFRFEFKDVESKVPNDQGIYIFFQNGESYSNNFDRIVRVGEAVNLKNRMKNHFSGNRNSSSFARQVGQALLKSVYFNSEKGKLLTDEEKSNLIKYWLKKNAPKDSITKKNIKEFTKFVSDYMRKNFSFTYFVIQNKTEKKDKEYRTEIESKIIATLYRDCNFYAKGNWIGKNMDTGMWLEQGLRGDDLTDCENDISDIRDFFNLTKENANV